MLLSRHRAALCAATTSLAALAALPGAAHATLSFATAADGTLTVTSDAAADTILLTADNGQLAINGTPVPSSAVPERSITVNAGAGADTVDLSALTAAHYRTAVINGEDDIDTLTGGAGHDRIVGGKANDTLVGGAGNDVLVWNNGDGTDVDDGGDGADEVEVNGAADRGDVFTIAPGAAAGRVQFNRTNFGNFGIDLSAERLTVNGLQGDETITAASGVAGRALLTLNGGQGVDTITGGDGADLISGGDDNDVLDGAGGDDRVVGDRGADTLRGAGGDDTLVWNNGDASDSDIGGDGSDRVEVNGAGAGDVFTVKPDGATTRFDRTNLVPFAIAVDAEQLLVNGLAGDDSLTVSDGLADRLAVVADGGAGKDTLTGAGELDTFLGGSGDDSVTGGAGADLLDGQDGNDTLSARDGAGDLVRGGAGDDSATTDRRNLDVVDGVESHDFTPDPVVTPQQVTVTTPAPPVGDTRALQPTLGKFSFVRKGKRISIEVPVTCPAAEAGGCDVRATLSTADVVRGLGVRAELGSGRIKLGAGKKGVLRFKLTPRAAQLGARGTRVRAALTSTDAAGNTVAWAKVGRVG